MSNLTCWNPYSRALSLRDAVNRMFEEKFLAPFERWPLWEGGFGPFALDVYEADDQLVVEASLPGIQPEDVDISITGNTLTIKGESREEAESKTGKYYYQEHRYGTMQRTIDLPVEVHPEVAEAVYKDGVLRITLPKVEGAKSKHIKVTTG